jgi:shikimate kinase
MRIFLIGLPGSGKTTLGKKISRSLNLEFVDTDEEICRKERTTVENIFAEKGEKYFREIERDTLKNLIEKDNRIISTGGGLPCFHDNIETINKSGISIFLNSSPEIITQRLFNETNHNRPLLKGKNQEDLLKFLHEKLKERFPFYSKANFEFKSDDLTEEKIISELKKRGAI